MSFKSWSWNLQQYCDITEYWWCAGFSHNWFTCKSLECGPCNSTEFFVFVCMFFFCQNFSAIISNKIKFLTHISLIGKLRLGFLPNGNLPLHGFQYNSSKLYKIFFQSLCWLKNLGKPIARASWPRDCKLNLAIKIDTEAAHFYLLGTLV